MRVAAMLLLAIFLMAGCSSPPTPTPTPIPLDRALAIAKEAMAKVEETGGSVKQIVRENGVAGQEMEDLLCAIYNGVYEPDLVLADLSDMENIVRAVEAHCLFTETVPGY